jgi:hypothetical protein
VLHRAAATAPVCVLLDDLHAADLGTLEVAALIALALRSARVMIVGSYRDLDARMKPDVEASLLRLARHGEALGPRRLDAAPSPTTGQRYALSPSSRPRRLQTQ